MAILNETSILQIVYSLYEGDSQGWDPSSDEYLAARVYANTAINRWEFYDQTNWHELWGTLTAAADGTKTTTLGTFSYACPTNMIRPASYVRVDGTFYNVIQVDKVASMAEDHGNWVYFTGSIKDGFKLNFNPNLTLTTGGVITYEYYKSASTFTATTSTTELSDPYFIVYFILSRFFENDGENGRASKAFQESESRLENMRTQNMMGLEGVADNIESSLDNSAGFGY